MNCLVLKPENNPDLVHQKETLIEALVNLTIIENTIINDNDEFFFAGKNYLHYISFLGCSPHLNFRPENEIVLSDLKETVADFNYIQFCFNSDHYSFKNTDFGVMAFCPACKSKIPEWNKLISIWEKNSSVESQCSQCQQSISIVDINWKKTAGFFKSAILFHGIQAELAAPTDQFLTLLENMTNVKWQYFYG